MNGKCFIVGGRIPKIFGPLEHEEDGMESLMGDGDDGVLEVAPDHKHLEPRLEY